MTSSYSWPSDSWVDPVSAQVEEDVALAVRVLPGRGRPFLLVHGLASNALLWRAVAESVHHEGHAVAAVDLRGHGRSDRPARGHSTATAAADLRQVLTALGWRARRPVLAGQSWGGNVALRAASGDDGWGGVVAVDGGWIHLRPRFPSFDDCWSSLAPPRPGPPDVVVPAIATMVADWPGHALEAVIGNLEVVDGSVRNRLDRDHHRTILRSLWEDDPAALYPGVQAPVHLTVAGRRSSDDVTRAAEALADVTVSWHPDAHHDIHLQQPDVVAAQLLAMAARVEGGST